MNAALCCFPPSIARLLQFNGRQQRSIRSGGGATAAATKTKTRIEGSCCTWIRMYVHDTQYTVQCMSVYLRTT